ncbi:MAG: thioredoxin-disulfide reductase [Candidatus Brocadiae bacterium]|nr:thioredoxin-disulfide reductase [Candidatus Brocadiia bacterium]
MSQDYDYDVVIIGGGCAGLTAGIYTARARLSTLLVDKIAPGGQLATTHEVENYPGFVDVMDGYELMERFRQQAERFGCQIEGHEVKTIDASDPVVRVVKTTGRDIRCRAVIVASGADPKTLGVPGEDRLRSKGVSYCATCDAPFFRDKEVAVIGGGNTAVDEGIYITRFASKVHVIHRRDELRAERIYQERILNNDKVVFHWDSVVDEFVGDEKLEKLVLKNVKTEEKSELPVQGAFVLIGTDPNTAFLEGVCELDDVGFVKVNERKETSVPGIFAGGDCEDGAFRQAVTAAGFGCAAAITAKHYLDNLS